MEGLKRFFTNRLVYLLIVLLAAAAALVARLYSLQIVDHGVHSDAAGKFSEYTLPLDAPRGNIYDRNGVLLATNRTAYEVYMVNTDDEQSRRDAMYLALIELFEKNGDIYNNFLGDYIAYPIAWGKRVDEEDETENLQAWIIDIAERKADRENFRTPESAFAYLRDTIFEIDPAYTEEQAYKIMIMRYATYMYGLDGLVPTLIASDVCKDTVDAITAASVDFPGISTEKTYFRVYVNNESLAPILGYVRAISEEEYEEKKDLGYFADDVIGKLGIEAAAEDYLRGSRGGRTYVKDTDGTVRETGYEAPVPGHDVYLTIDIKLQQDSFTSLKDNIAYVVANRNDVDNFGDCKAGSIVVSDVRTGEVLAMVTYPTYDNSIFIAPSSDEEAQKKIVALFKDATAPSLNRATQGAYPIGSNIKPAVAVAALENGLVDENTTIECKGFVTFSGRQQKCLAVHGKLTLEYAIARSCNSFFATVGVELGIEEVDKWIRAFGLGENTGIEISEFKGYRSNPESMDIFEAGTFHKWSDASTAQTCIGQLYTMFTPIQINRYTAAIANGGYLNTMHLIKRVISRDGALVYETPIEQQDLGISDRTISLVQKSMITMADSYQDLKAFMVGYPDGFMGGKTGTAQTGGNLDSSHAFFMCFAPASEPQIAITVALENGAYSGNGFFSVRRICDSYFGGVYRPGAVGGIGVYEDFGFAREDGTAFGSGYHNIMDLVSSHPDARPTPAEATKPEAEP